MHMREAGSDHVSKVKVDCVKLETVTSENNKKKNDSKSSTRIIQSVLLLYEFNFFISQ